MDCHEDHLEEETKAIFSRMMLVVLSLYKRPTAQKLTLKTLCNVKRDGDSKSYQRCICILFQNVSRQKLRALTFIHLDRHKSKEKWWVHSSTAVIMF